MNINPYLYFDGNTEEAFNFYRSVFGGEFAMLMRLSEAPGEYKFSESHANRIMHIALPIGKDSMLMASDTTEQQGSIATGANVQIMVSADSREDATRIFNGLSAQGKVTMPLEDTFWGAFFGTLTDKFGIHWMISFDKH